MIESQQYIVEIGDSLSTIARKFGLSSWQFIYQQVENKALFAQRRNADDIRAGDLLIIPPNPVVLLEIKIKNLENIKRDTTQMYDRLLTEMNAEYRKIKKFGAKIDLAGDLMQLGVGYAKIVKGGMDTMKLAGKELELANEKLAQSVLTNGPHFAAEQTIKNTSILSISSSESLLTAIPKIVLQSWFDMTSPSYWAQRISGVNVEKVHAQTIANLQRQQKEMLHKIQIQIDAAKANHLKIRNL